jgi:hypothetical protein
MDLWKQSFISILDTQNVSARIFQSSRTWTRRAVGKQSIYIKKILVYHNPGKAPELHEMEAHSLIYTKVIQE